MWLNGRKKGRMQNGEFLCGSWVSPFPTSFASLPLNFPFRETMPMPCAVQIPNFFHTKERIQFRVQQSGPITQGASFRTQEQTDGNK